jgi:hypothetical protein
MQVKRAANGPDLSVRLKRGGSPTINTTISQITARSILIDGVME